MLNTLYYISAIFCVKWYVKGAFRLENNKNMLHRSIFEHKQVSRKVSQPAPVCLVVVFDGTVPEKTGPKDGTKFWGPGQRLQ